MRLSASAAAAHISQHIPQSLAHFCDLKAPVQSLLSGLTLQPKLAAPSAADLWPAAALPPALSTALIPLLQDHWRLACLRSMDAPWQPSNRRYNGRQMRELGGQHDCLMLLLLRCCGPAVP